MVLAKKKTVTVELTVPEARLLAQLLDGACWWDMLLVKEGNVFDKVDRQIEAQIGNFPCASDAMIKRLNIAARRPEDA